MLGSILARVTTRKTLVLLTVLLATSGTLGCKKLLKRKIAESMQDSGLQPYQGGLQNDGTTATSPEEESDQKLSQKLDAYVKCINTMSSPVHSTRHRYFSWVDPKTGPTGKERFVYGLYDIPKNQAEKCAADVAKAKTMTPPQPALEAAADQFSASLTALDGIVDQAYTYYENKNYKDDKFAKGKTLHPQLMSAFSAFSKADTALHTELDNVTKPLAQRTLARIEKDEGKKHRWHRRNVLIKARELIEAGDPIGDDDDIDPKQYDTAYTAFETAVTDLDTYHQANGKDLEDRRKTSTILAKSNADQFIRYAGEYRKKAKEWQRCLAAAPAKAKMPNGKIDPEKMQPCPDGKRRDVLQKFNDFIDQSNRGQFP